MSIDPGSSLEHHVGMAVTALMSTVSDLAAISKTEDGARLIIRDADDITLAINKARNMLARVKRPDPFLQAAE